MSLPIHVDAYSGYKANERPTQFCLDEDGFEITEVEDRWYERDAEYFRVRTPEGKRYILRYDSQEDQWTLQSGFDGAELLAGADRSGLDRVAPLQFGARPAILGWKSSIRHWCHGLWYHFFS